MKRQTKTVTKRTYSLKGAIPRFVTLCGAGANLTPLTKLKYSESEKFGQDVEINRIEFAKSKFVTKEIVEQYLSENAYEEFSVEETDDTWLVPGTESGKFENVQQVEYEDGVLYFIGKLKVEEDIETPAAEVVSAEEFAGEKPKELDDTKVKPDSDGDNDSENPDDDEDDKKKKEVDMADTTISDNSPAKSQPDSLAGKKLKKKKADSYEETNSATEESTGEKVGEEFTAEEEIQEEVVNEEKNLSFAQVNELIEVMKVVFQKEVDELKEKLSKFEENKQETIDEQEVFIQTTKAINSDEIVSEEVKQTDEKAEKFSQARKNDLFGLRG